MLRLVRLQFRSASISLRSLVLVALALAIPSYVVDAVLVEPPPDNLQYLFPVLMVVYAVLVASLLAAVVAFSTPFRRSSERTERWVNGLVIVTTGVGGAIWLVGLIMHAVDAAGPR